MLNFVLHHSDTIKVHNGDDCSLFHSKPSRSAWRVKNGCGRRATENHFPVSLFQSHQLSGFASLLSKLNRRLGISFLCNIFLRRVSESTLFSLKIKREISRRKKWKNGSRETFSVVFIDFFLLSLSSFFLPFLCVVSSFNRYA